MKNCLFVGSFNPITLAHERIAFDLLKEKKVDFIYFLPVNSQKKDLVSISSRIEMIHLIKNKKMEVLNIYEYEENGLFSFPILSKIKKDYSITHLVMGSDLFLKLDTFYKYEEILKDYILIIIKRGDIELLDVTHQKYSFYRNKFILINKDYLGSSTLVKEGLKKKETMYLNLKVLEYIKQNGLYN